jgi:hypothetical protein
MGFTLPPLLPKTRCALTAPFHPYLLQAKGGLFSVALSLRFPPPDVIRHSVFWSPDFPPEQALVIIRSSGIHEYALFCIENQAERDFVLAVLKRQVP